MNLKAFIANAEWVKKYPALEKEFMNRVAYDSYQFKEGHGFLECVLHSFKDELTSMDHATNRVTIFVSDPSGALQEKFNKDVVYKLVVLLQCHDGIYLNYGCEKENKSSFFTYSKPICITHFHSMEMPIIYKGCIEHDLQTIKS